MRTKSPDFFEKLLCSSEASNLYSVPRLFEWQGYIFFFYSNEGDPLEPAHVHVRKGSSVAKFWVEPEVSLANSWGFNSTELTRLDKVVRERQSEIRSKLNE